MKKLSLRIDDVAVESFPTSGDGVADVTKTLLDLCTQMTGLCPCTPRADEY